MLLQGSIQLRQSEPSLQCSRPCCTVRLLLLPHLDGELAQHLLLLQLLLLAACAAGAAASVPNQVQHACSGEQQQRVAWAMAGCHQLQLSPRPSGVPVGHQGAMPGAVYGLLGV